MTLSPITPENTPRQVIPFGDRAIVDPRTGMPTTEMYQWMNRVSGGLVSSITNISTTINETNTISETVNNIDADVTGIEAEIATINDTLGVLQGEIAATQFDAGNTPTPPPPSIPAAAVVQQVVAPPPAPARYGGAADFVELEAGGVPTKISAMPDASLPLAGTEVILLVQSNGNVKLVFPISGGAGSTVIIPLAIGDTIQLQSANQVAAATPSPDVFVFSGAPGTGANSGAGNYGTGDANSGGNSGDAFLYTGNASSGSSGGAFVGSGNSSGKTGDTAIYTGDSSAADSGLIGISSGAAPAGNTGNIGLRTGDAGGGNSGTIELRIGTATGTQGNILFVNIPTSPAGLPADAIWVDTSGGLNILKKV